MSDSVEGQTFHDVAALNSLEEGKIHPLSVAGHAIVLVRRGDEVQALGGRCPHKGAPIDQGALCHTKANGDVLVCPWHKAVFSAATGELVEPIAFAPLPTYPVEVIQGRVLVGIRPKELPQPAPIKKDESVLIIGGGGAAASAIYTLRQGGYAGKITMISREKILPYNRTALSKTVILSDPEKLKLPFLLDESYYQQNNIEVIYDTVVAFDPATHIATLKDGSTKRGDNVILAMGAKPNQLDVPGADLEGVMTLRNLKEAQHMAEVIKPEDVVVLVGGGFICLEVASALRQKGVGVTVILAESVPMESQFGRELGLMLLHLHEENSVAFIRDSKLVKIHGDSKVNAIELDDGTVIPCSHVLSAVGVTPDSDFIEGLPKDNDGSLIVNDEMKLTDKIYAVGDVSAMHRNGRNCRFEHWRHAQIQGRIAAKSIMGAPLDGVPTPWFWTQQFGKKLEYLGWGEPFDRVIIEGDMRKYDFIATFRAKERIVGIVSSGRAAAMAEAAVNYDQFIEDDSDNSSM
ncbi:FAD-dependent oxidoreductase [Aristophania vespae]|uniref:FAD-dependent oxidoreductase n=1 Tax=Aristophania vespae TaxID=2697033 RepID=A0A6P1NFH4_9PROT|nr:FAD-dependent oxidoreductase [Aristophania vespae]QHI95290.1 FAD-dependent oxidoreductase [Aristophania vespae]